MPRIAHAGTGDQGPLREPGAGEQPLGDPAERDLLVYLPPRYERSPSQRYPVVFALAGYSESDASLQN